LGIINGQPPPAVPTEEHGREQLRHIADAIKAMLHRHVEALAREGRAPFVVRDIPGQFNARRRVNIIESVKRPAPRGGGRRSALGRPRASRWTPIASTSLEKILHTQSPRHLFLCGAEGGLISADGPSQENRHRNDNSGVTATDVLELGIRQGADIRGILCVVHFSLHACARIGPFRHRHGDFWRAALSGAVIAVTGWSIYDFGLSGPSG
jgi:hypothetical protein